MSRRPLLIAGNDAALLRLDPTAPIILVAMPLILAAIFKPAWAPVLHAEGFPKANGAEQSVPGAAVMFAFFMVSYAGTAFFREHVWATWDRVRCTPASPLEMALGKIISPFALLCVQQAVLMVIGATLFGLHLAGSWATFALVDLSFTLWLTALIFATITFCQSLQQVLAISNLGALVFAGLGGALTPLKTLPHWAQTIAPASPIYWAMRGFKQVALQGGGLGTVAPSLAVLAGSALLIGAASALRFKVDAEKGGTLIA